MPEVAIYDQVCVQTTSMGNTGVWQLGAAVPGYDTLAQADAVDGASVLYVRQDGLDNRAQWQKGRGVLSLSGAPTLTSQEVYGSSNSDAAITWGSGVGYVFFPMLSRHQPVLDTERKLPRRYLGDTLITELLSGSPVGINSMTSTPMSWNTLRGNSLGAATGQGPHTGLVIGESGVYRYTADMSMQGSAAGSIRQLQVKIGPTYASSTVYSKQVIRGPDMVLPEFHRSRELFIPAGNAVFVELYHDAGTALTAGGSPSSFFTLTRLLG